MTLTNYKQTLLRPMALLCAGTLVALMALMMSANAASAATTVHTQSQTDVAELYILAELFDSENGDSLLGGDTDLGKLIILEELFAGGSSEATVMSGDRNWAELFILAELFNNDDSDNDGATTSAMDGDSNNEDTNLTELFVLSELFAGGTGVLSGNQRTVVVERGDTLSGIALQVYGNASLYPVIADANNITNPNVIRVGQTLVIPELNRQAFGQSNIAELFILEEILGSDNGGDKDLAELFILMEVLGRN